MPVTPASERRIVWVLGAGFSYSLGGPLLNDFFTESLNQKLFAVAGVRGIPSLNAIVNDVDRVYVARDAHRAPVRGEDRPWKNAEEFLEVVDTASDEQVGAGGRDAARAMLDPFLDPSSDENRYRNLTSDARLYLAAACHLFVPMRATEVVERLERWKPYRRWCNELLEDRDAVITFNYDMVPEVASAGRLRPMAPVGTSRPEIRSRKRTTYLKLHGSVDWSIEQDQLVVDQDPVELLRSGRLVALAGPGPSKLSFAQGTSVDLWAMAEERVREAHVVVFVGYRFPETDNHAMRQILTALAANREEPLTVRIVLGPDVGSKEIVRARALIESALRSRSPVAEPEARRLQENRRLGRRTPVVAVVPLFAEDLLTLYSRDDLHFWGTADEPGAPRDR